MQDNGLVPKGLLAKRLTAIGAAVGVTALVVGFALFNMRGSAASECPAQPEAAARIDAAAIGQLAAMNGTGQGRAFADMAFEDAEGKPVTIASFAGKALLVNFWASWCVPCREEMPELERLAARHNSDQFMVLPINLDVGQSGLEKGRDFLAEGQWPNLPLYADPSFRVFDRLKTEAVAIGLPATILLDAKGCELAVLQGPAKWDSTDGDNVVKALLASS